MGWNILTLQRYGDDFALLPRQSVDRYGRDGAAGIRYRSNLDNRPCFALFEGRAGLYPVDTDRSFNARQLMQVARQYNLQVRVEDVQLMHHAVYMKATDPRVQRDRRRTSVGYVGPERRSGNDRRDGNAPAIEP